MKKKTHIYDWLVYMLVIWQISLMEKKNLLQKNWKSLSKYFIKKINRKYFSGLMENLN